MTMHCSKCGCGLLENEKVMFGKHNPTQMMDAYCEPCWKEIRSKDAKNPNYTNESMIDAAHRAEIEAHYRSLNPQGDERDAREFVATVEFQFEVERRKMAEEIAALKAKIEKAQGILAKSMDAWMKQKGFHGSPTLTGAINAALKALQ